MNETENLPIRATTVVCVRRNERIAMAAEGQVTLGNTIIKGSARKIRRLYKDQVLVDTGLYAHVSHPLYAGGSLMILATPIALGSWWALLPAALTALTIIARIKPEEEMLLQGMKGYEDYRKRVKYKLIPKIY